MKANERTTVNKPSVETYLTEEMKKNPETGDIKLEVIEKETGLERGDVVKQLRAFKATGSIYAVGRRGHKSRFLWGAAKDEYKSHLPQNLVKRQPKVESNGNGYKLAVTVGNDRHEIPIKMELVH